MDSMNSVSIIIPTYNEAKNIEPLITEIFSVLNQSAIAIDAEIIIVDDNSPDGTANVAEQLAARYPVRIIKRAAKLGLGSAVIAGFNATNRPIIGVMDADLSHDATLIPQLISALNEHDIAIGSRLLPASQVENWTPSRRSLSLVGVTLARLLTPVRDPLSGYFFLRRSVIDGVKLTTNGYKILFEILIKGHYQSYIELPFTFRVRRYSSSKLNYREYWLFAGQLVAYAVYKIIKIF